MRKFSIAIAAATVLVAGMSLFEGNTQRAEASPLGAAAGIRLAVEGVDAIENVARCFYVDGWHGPGFYRCGYRHRRGEGWYGPREERREERREYRREDRREDHRDRDRPSIPMIR
jgi:hypothetical protein